MSSSPAPVDALPRRDRAVGPSRSMRRPRLRWSSLLVTAAVMCALVAIYLSSTLARVYGLRQGPAPHQYPAPAILAFVGAGLGLALAVLIRPALLWRLTIVVAILTPGMYVLGFPIFDEWLIGCLTTAGGMAVLSGRVRSRPRALKGRWTVFFLALVFLLLAESIVGGFVYDNPKAVRFVLGFAVVFCLALLLACYQFPVVPRERIAFLVAASGAAYFALYIAHGLVFIDVVFAYNMEGLGGAGAAYANFPLCVTGPAAVLCIARGTPKERIVGYLGLSLACLVGILSDSRAGLFALVGLVGVTPFALGIAQSVKLAWSLLLVLVLTGTFLWSNPYYFENIVDEITGFFDGIGGNEEQEYFGEDIDISRGDTARFYLISGAIDTLLDNPTIFIAGAGVYGFWPNADPYVEKHRERYAATSAILNYGASLGDGPVERPRPPAWPALIVETGIIGIFLFCANVVYACFVACVRPHGARIAFSRPGLLIACVPGLAFLWGAFGEIQDNMLLYVVLMPFGLTDMWARGPREGSQDGR